MAPAGSRLGIRRSVSLPCELISNRRDVAAICTATDLSTTGLWLSTDEPVRAGEHVVVCFQPGDGWTLGELVVFAEVTRVITVRMGSVGGGMGLEFMDLRAVERTALDAWLLQRRMPVPRRRRPLPRRGPPPLPTLPIEGMPLSHTSSVVTSLPVVPPSLAPVSAPALSVPSLPSGPQPFRPPAVWR